MPVSRPGGELGRVDPNRTYITGLSLGSWGASHILWRRPDLFASALLCTGGMDARAPKCLKDVKIWWFMGTEDREELVIPAKKRAEACRKLGVDITYTEIKGGDHASSWRAAYGNPKVWDWVFAPKKKDR